MSDSTRMMLDIRELFARAHNYDDKPHQLYSHIAAMADRYGLSREYRAEIQRLMDNEYMRPRRERMTHEEFCLRARIGDRVRAVRDVYDLPGAPDPGHLVAETGDLGTVVHVQKGYCPTVTFDRTGHSTCVFTSEVELVSPEVEDNG